MSTPRPRSASGSQARDAGFSLLEIMIALVILALAMTIVGASFVRASASYRFEAAAQELALNLREAQARALRGGRDVALVIDADQHAYRLQDDAVVQIPEDVEIRIVSAGQAMRGANPAFDFAPDGGSTGGAVTLSLDGRRTVIAVDWLTGAVTVTEGDADASPG